MPYCCICHIITLALKLSLYFELHLRFCTKNIRYPKVIFDIKMSRLGPVCIYICVYLYMHKYIFFQFFAFNSNILVTDK